MLLVSDTFSPPRGFLCCAAPFSPKGSQSCTLLQSPALGPHPPPDPLRQQAGFLTAAPFIFCMLSCPFVYTQAMPSAVGFSSLVLVFCVPPDSLFRPTSNYDLRTPTNHAITLIKLFKAKDARPPFSHPPCLIPKDLPPSPSSSTPPYTALATSTSSSQPTRTRSAS